MERRRRQHLRDYLDLCHEANQVHALFPSQQLGHLCHTLQNRNHRHQERIEGRLPLHKQQPLDASNQEHHLAVLLSILPLSLVVHSFRVD